MNRWSYSAHFVTICLLTKCTSSFISSETLQNLTCDGIIEMLKCIIWTYFDMICFEKNPSVWRKKLHYKQVTWPTSKVYSFLSSFPLILHYPTRSWFLAPWRSSSVTAVTRETAGCFISHNCFVAICKTLWYFIYQILLFPM